MAAFSQGGPQRLDLELLQNGSINLYFNPVLLEEACQWFRGESYQISVFHCDTWETSDDFDDDVSRILDFPDYYGRNLSAFNDCLAYIDVPHESGRLLVFHRFDTFAKRFPKFAYDVLDIIERDSRGFLLYGQRLITLIQSNDPKISFKPVGALSVSWNSKEWLNKKRGL